MRDDFATQLVADADVPPATRPAARANRRSAKTRRALRDALAAEIRESGGLDRVAVTAIAERAGVTRRTFYSHYKDIPDLVASSEDELLGELACHIHAIAQTNLAELSERVGALMPCPGAVELLDFVRDNGDYISAMMGPGGDPAFSEKIKRIAIDTVAGRALEGMDASIVAVLFDYYLAFAVSAELGVLQRWLEGGMRESTEVMARIMTVLMFVRPGDLYGRPIDIDLAHYGGILMQVAAMGE